MISDGVTGPLRWAAENRPLDGETLSGDRHVVRTIEGGALVAVIDGLGHGKDAATAAALAAYTLESTDVGSVTAALEACHAALSRSRGAVISIVCVARRELSWGGVGNVEGLLVYGRGGALGRARLPTSNGVVGHVMPPPRPARRPLARGDLIVLATDGLSSDVMEQVPAFASPRAVVDELMLRCRTGRDDALVLAARYDGEAG